MHYVLLSNLIGPCYY